MAFRIVHEDFVFKFKKLCPYCQADLHYVCTGWIQDDDGLWMADNIESICQHEPDDMESDEWNDWMNSHSEMPYVHQMPVDEKIKQHINKKYRFELNHAT